METMRGRMAWVGWTAPKTAGFRRSKAEREGVAPFPHRARSPRRRWGGVAITGVLAALVLGCGGSPTEPGALDTLVAVSVDGESLPATVVDWPDFHLELLADTVRFSGETYAHRRITRFTGIVGVPEIHETGTDGSVRIDGRSITLEPSCDALSCVDIVLMRVGNRYWAMWAPVEGVEVLVEFRAIVGAEPG